MLVHEPEQARPQFLYLGGVVEVHEISGKDVGIVVKVMACAVVSPGF